MEKTIKSIVIMMLTLAFVLVASSCDLLNDLQNNVQKNTAETSTDATETQTDKKGGKEATDDKGENGSDSSKTEASENNNLTINPPSAPNASGVEEEVPQNIKNLVVCYDGFNNEGMQKEGVEVELPGKEEYINTLLSDIKDAKEKKFFEEELLKMPNEKLRKSTVECKSGIPAKEGAEKAYTVETDIIDIKKAKQIFEKEIESLDVDKIAADIADTVLKGELTKEISAERKAELLKEEIDKILSQKASEALEKAGTITVQSTITLKKDGDKVTYDWPGVFPGEKNTAITGVNS